MRILIDADACPVTQIAIRIGKEYNKDIVAFCDTSHNFDSLGVQVITVGKGADSADFALVNNTQNGDIVITQDYGLAAMVLAKGGKPITQNGKIITNNNIDTLLLTRYAAKKARNSGYHTKGPAKRQKEQDILFENNLRKLIEENENTDCT